MTINKNLIKISGILILIFLISGCFEKQGPIDRINTNIPSNFLYQNKYDKIPEEYLITEGAQFNNELIYKKEGNPEVYCKISDKEAEKIEYFVHSPGPEYYGGWYNRYAYVCDDKYWILDEDDSFGSKLYGPFNK